MISGIKQAKDYCSCKKKKVARFFKFCIFACHLKPMGLNVLGYQSHLYCNVAILPVDTKDLPISPRFSPRDFYRDLSGAQRPVDPGSSVGTS